jgi:hypothetical protein
MRCGESCTMVLSRSDDEMHIGQQGVTMVRTLNLTLFASLAFAVAASAQQPVDAFSQLPERVKPGSVVIVIDEQGQRTKGKITNLSPTSLQILTTGLRERHLSFPADRVWHVNRVDSRLNGFLIGTVVGAVPGILIGVGFMTYCTNEATTCPSAPAIFGTTTGLLGGWIGYGIDGLIDGQELVYSRKAAARPGIQFSLRF